MRVTIRCTDDGGDVRVSTGGAEIIFSGMKTGEEVTVMTDSNMDLSGIKANESENDEVVTDINNVDACGNDLFKRLTALRRTLASKQGVPPYVIFNDRSLREMTEKLPADIESFGSINGVGESKLKKYGDIFIKSIGEYLKEMDHDI